MKVLIMQPTYLPWIGFFDKLTRVDTLVYLDDAQFKKNAFINRNKIKHATGWGWLTVPVKFKNNSGVSINELELKNENPWMRKHWNSIQSSYGKAPYFERLEAISAIYQDGREFKDLASLCVELDRVVMSELGIRLNILKSSDLGVEGQASDKLVGILKKVGASDYLSGPFGREYLDTRLFEESSIKLSFHDYVCPQYNQLHGDFMANMCVLDLLVNERNPLEKIVSGGSESES